MMMMMMLILMLLSVADIIISQFYCLPTVSVYLWSLSTIYLIMSRISFYYFNEKKERNEKTYMHIAHSNKSVHNLFFSSSFFGCDFSFSIFLSVRRKCSTDIFFFLVRKLFCLYSPVCCGSNACIVPISIEWNVWKAVLQRNQSWNAWRCLEIWHLNSHTKSLPI